MDNQQSNPSSTIYIKNLTVIDHAWINQHGVPVGGSFNPTFLLTGALDQDERVVVDFGTAKKMLKAIIDDPTDGLDHKLWVFDTPIDYQLNKEHVASHWFEAKFGDQHAVRRIPLSYREYSKTGKLAAWMGEWLSLKLAEMGQRVKVEVQLESRDFDRIRSHPEAPSPHARTFTYTHGLAKSTSWGCQNVVHGHLSWVYADATSDVELVNENLARLLDLKYFYNQKHRTGVFRDSISYESRDRGLFTFDCNHAPFKDSEVGSQFQAIAINDEPTIEALARWVAVQHFAMLKDKGVTKIYLSEGPTKGCVFNLSELG